MGPKSMPFFGILRNAICTVFTILSHDSSLWKCSKKRFIFGVSFGSTSRVPPETVKMQQESPQTRKEVEKLSQIGFLLAWKKPGKGLPRGWTNASRGHILTLRWSDVLSECNFAHFTSFLTSKMSKFGTKSDLF